MSTKQLKPLAKSWTEILASRDHFLTDAFKKKLDLKLDLKLDSVLSERTTDSQQLTANERCKSRLPEELKSISQMHLARRIKEYNERNDPHRVLVTLPHRLSYRAANSNLARFARVQLQTALHYRLALTMKTTNSFGVCVQAATPVLMFNRPKIKGGRAGPVLQSRVLTRLQGGWFVTKWWQEQLKKANHQRGYQRNEWIMNQELGRVLQGTSALFAKRFTLHRGGV